MAELFLKVVNMSIAASWIVLVVIVLRLLLKKAPKWICVVLWGLVAVRLIFPFALESVLSLIPSAETISPDIMMDRTPEIQSGIPAINHAVNPIISQSFAPGPADSANPLQVWIPVLSIIWIAGVLVMALYTVISYWKLRRRVRTAVRLRENIFQSEKVASPFVMGILKPRIYVPFTMGEVDMNHVIAHEQTHIRRKDHWWKPIGFVLLMLHWFNPLMWVAYILLCRDIELACDEKVVETLRQEQRADYAQALLSCSVNRKMIAACPLAFGEVGVKERVKSVLHYKKPAFWMIAVALVACITVAMCFLTNPKDVVDSGNPDIPDSGKQLTLDDVISLSEKGETLTWSDFEGFQYHETGSGLYIRVYEIDELFSVMIGGPNWEMEPWYIYLRTSVEPETTVDIRSGGVTAFIEAQQYQYDVLKNSLSATEIAALLDIICASPAEASNPGAYIEAHPEEYNQLILYGEDTLQYCFREFLKGGQNDLRGIIMAEVCDEICLRLGEALIIDTPEPVTDQAWFDWFKSSAENLAAQCSDEEMQQCYPASWMLLQMMEEA